MNPSEMQIDTCTRDKFINCAVSVRRGSSAMQLSTSVFYSPSKASFTESFSSERLDKDRTLENELCQPLRSDVSLMAPLAEPREASYSGHCFIVIHYPKFRGGSDSNSQWQNPESFQFLLAAELHSLQGEVRVASHINENKSPLGE